MPIDISVIIPVYNTMQYLTQCLESVVEQKGIAFEIILIDDGSTDGSGALCDMLAAQYPLTRVIHKQNGGLSSARNAGLAVASGKYILFLDSDDLLPNDEAMKKMLAIIAQADTDVLCFDYNRFSDRTTLAVLSKKGRICYHPPNGVDDSLDHLVRHNAYPSSACFKLVLRRLLDENDITFEEGRYCEDVYYSGLLLAHAKRVVFLGEVLYAYRVRPGSITTMVGPKQFLDLLHAVEQLAMLAQTCPVTRRRALLGYAAFQYCTLLINWRLAGSPNQKDEFQRIQALAPLLKESRCSVVRLVRACSALLGLRCASKLLQGYYTLAQRRIK